MYTSRATPILRLAEEEDAESASTGELPANTAANILIAHVKVVHTNDYITHAFNWSAFLIVKYISMKIIRRQT